MHACDERLARDWERLRDLHPGRPAHHAARTPRRRRSSWPSTTTATRARPTSSTARAGAARAALPLAALARPGDAGADAAGDGSTSRDGLALHSYLTLPLDVEPRGLPAVLLVHGGPWARDAWGYDPEAQFLANRGYAVLQVNYRGSTRLREGVHPRGRARVRRPDARRPDRRGRAGWSGEGIADRDRVGIYGGSYGGYAALVGATFTPDVFAAAVSVVGPSSLVTWCARSRPTGARSWRAPGSATSATPRIPSSVADLEARSPLNRVADIRCAAARDPGGQRPARHEGRVGPDRGGAARPRRRRSSTWSRRTRATGS